jgi:hypothetical protein
MSAIGTYESRGSQHDPSGDKGWRHYSEVSQRNSYTGKGGLGEIKRQKPRTAEGMLHRGFHQAR